MPSFIEIYNVDKKLCDDLIKYHHEDTRYKSKGSIGIKNEIKVIDRYKESTDVTFHNDTQNKTIRELFKVLSTCVSQYTKKYSMYYRVETEYTNVISMFPPLGGYKEVHHERTCVRNCRRQLVYMLYLNDVTDGGGTEFVHQQIKTQAKKGNLIIWPSDFTHRHRGIVSPTQTKYIATGWFEIAF